MVANETKDDDVVFNKVKQLLSDGDNIFITGGGGVGKSYLLNKLKNFYGELLVLTSTTGISAINIGGQTLHSWVGIGLGEKPVPDVIRKINRKSGIKAQIMNCKLLAIDEISMLDDYTMGYVDEVLQTIRHSTKPFGGIQLILVGDFFQLPPVMIGNRANSRSFCFKCKTWANLNLVTVLLKKVKRQSDKEFINALNNVRINKTSFEDLKVFYKRSYPQSFVPDKNILQIFGTNYDADAYNALCFKELDAKSYTYLANDVLYPNDEEDSEPINVTNLTVKELSYIDKKCFDIFNKDCKAPKYLDLKVGCRVMLLKNVDVSCGLVNGLCGTVKFLSDRSILVNFDNGKLVKVEMEEFSYHQDGKLKIKRIQYPLRLAYGITIHKSQGMTFDKLVVNFNRIFAYGQGYVALSRTRNLDGLFIKGFNPAKIKANFSVLEFYADIEQSDRCIIFD